jgi:hypothetical protein
VQRYFDDHPEGLYLKRYRCTDCAAVHTARPDTHYRGFWASIRCVVGCVYEKAVHGRWIGELSRQRQQYWWRGFLKQASRQSIPHGDPRDLVASLLSRNIILSTHSLHYYEIRPLQAAPYPIFAVTAPTGYG